jgi:hypothetical protein
LFPFLNSRSYDPMHNGMSSHNPRYAVLFRTHVWDKFIDRQYGRLCDQIGNGDVFVVANNTSGTCNPPDDLPLVSFCEGDIVDLGYAKGGSGEMLWYNVDYALYYFAKLKPDYDYYVLFEYDVVVTVPLDEVIAAVHASGIDLVGLSTSDPISEWWFRSSCLEVYKEEELRKMLLPLGIFSSNAVRHLSRRRLELSGDLRSGQLQTWPHCEAFIPTELARAGYVIEELSRFGPSEHLNHTPPLLEHDLGAMQGESFLHPVLDTPRYVANAIKYEYRPESFFLPSSILRQRLRRVAVGHYVGPLCNALRARAASLPHILARRLGLSRATEP